MTSCMCMGPQGGEPYCPCVMKRIAWEKEQLGKPRIIVSTGSGGSHVPSDVELLTREIARLRELINAPVVKDFTQGVVTEAAHQRDRWGSKHDEGKTPADWFWLIGYLAQKAMMAQLAGDQEKALHHCVSTAAALANWHAAISGVDNSMRPGIKTPEV